jgi:mannosyltransferase OCH1-like enzyme
MLNYNTKTPILLIAINKQNSRTISQLRKVGTEKLYIAIVVSELSSESIVNQINWKCSIDILPQNEDIEKLTVAIGKAISYFFEKEKEGIVLLDNCLPSDSFFGFCSEMLEKYRNDERISQICGINVQNGINRGDGSYYFSSLTQTKAWASWRRAWQGSEKSIESFPFFEESKFLNNQSSFKPFKQTWLQHFKVAHHYASNLWNLNFAYHNIVNNRMSIVPNVNMIENAGYDYFSYPFKQEMPLKDATAKEITEIYHPSIIMSDAEADIQTQRYEFDFPRFADVSMDGILLLQKRLQSLSKNISMKIPRIIHQIYVCEKQDGEVPNDLLNLSKTWKEHHPDWEYRFWDKESINEFLDAVCPDFAPYYRAFPFNVQRWDTIRYLILYYIGGFYVDMDYECLEPIDVLFGDSSCCMGMEPQENAISNRKNMIIGNAFMASVPKHKYFEEIIEDIKREKTVEFPNKALQIMETTGPFMITRIYESFSDKEDITLLPAELIAPLGISEVQDLMQGKETKEMEDKIEKAFAIHYFGGSWWSQTQE